jgi:hypothetical protein
MEKDDSESDEDEHIKSVEEKLKLLKKLKKHHVKGEKKESPEKIPEPFEDIDQLRYAMLM